jgi:DNA-directed RNA polymerase sigma subunit (sigma70/sigma32)
MTLRQVAERIGISFARVKQIESQALIKIRKRCQNKGITF